MMVPYLSEVDMGMGVAKAAISLSPSSGQVKVTVTFKAWKRLPASPVQEAHKHHVLGHPRMEHAWSAPSSQDTHGSDMTANRPQTPI